MPTVRTEVNPVTFHVEKGQIYALGNQTVEIVLVGPLKDATANQCPLFSYQQGPKGNKRRLFPGQILYRDAAGFGTCGHDRFKSWRRIA